MRNLWWILFWMGCQPMEAGKPFEAAAPEPCECECEDCPEVETTADTDATADGDATGTEGEQPTDPEDGEPPVESVGTEGDPFAAAIQETETPEETETEAPEEVVADTAWEGSLTHPGWGVRLVSVVPGGSPAEAVLGLPDGTSQVVRAGDLLPSVGVVVLAIGKNRVQLAQVKAAGDHATVESVQLSALYPNKE